LQILLMTDNTIATVPSVAVVTGISRGLGFELARGLVASGWHVVGDARDAAALDAAMQDVPAGRVTAVPGDVTDPEHRRELAATAREAGPVRLLVHNASTLGPSPLPPLAELAPAALRDLFEANVVAPLALTQLLLPDLRAVDGQIVHITSDAGSEAYAGWGGYGSTKAALDQLGAVLAEEHPQLRVHVFDPGDMNTAMHQLAFPGEDISDRPTPATVVPAFLRLVAGRLPSGRYSLTDLAVAAAPPAPAVPSELSASEPMGAQA
jgi:NAD(P)-dependent dehydrogenase (short-subunit alcohol dehydrogenase family)